MHDGPIFAPESATHLVRLRDGRAFSAETITFDDGWLHAVAGLRTRTAGEVRVAPLRWYSWPRHEVREVRRALEQGS